MAKTNLDFNNIGAWPRQAKMGFCALVALLILVLAWLLLFRGQREELATAESQEATLRSQFEEKAGRAANLEPLKAQLAQMESDLQQMLRQLPSKTEMPDVIVDISQAALASGLRIERFKPEDEVKKEIYAEKPIGLSLVGTFHQFGAFVSSVASLPRVVIMTMTNVELTPKDKDKGGILVMAGTVKTYRYLDESETTPVDKSKGKAAAPKKDGTTTTTTVVTTPNTEAAK